jgi:tetratricopeptide (TPR) repeat protein
VKQNQNNRKGLLESAVQLCRNCQFKRAIENFSIALAREPEHFKKLHFYLYAKSLRRLKLNNEALPLCEQALALDPSDENTKEQLAWILFNIHFDRDVTEPFTLAEKLQAATRILSLCKHESGTPYERTVLHILAEITKQHPVDYVLLLTWCNKMESLDVSAKDKLRDKKNKNSSRVEVYKHASNAAKFYYFKALAQFELGQYREALFTIDEADAELSKNFYEIHQSIRTLEGRALSQIGQHDKAAVLFENLFQRKKTIELATYTFHEYCRLGNPDKAKWFCDFVHHSSTAPEALKQELKDHLARLFLTV